MLTRNDSSRFSTVRFRAVERVQDPSQPEVEIFTETRTLWEARRASGGAQAAPLPTVMAFRFPLTSDLPHCIHLSSSELVYSLEATLHGDGLAEWTCRTTVHPTRYMRPEREALTAATHARGDISYALEPVFWSVESPVRVFCKLDATTVRRTEPVHVHVHIPAQPDTIISEQLQLQSIQANLVRIISAHSAQESFHDSAYQRLLEGSSDMARGESSSACSNDLAQSAQICTVARTGKACRFNSHKAVHLSLALHPTSTLSNIPTLSTDSMQNPCQMRHSELGPCESITQHTPLHDVHFGVQVRIAMRDANAQTRDIVLCRLVRIMPGPAGPVLYETQDDTQLSADGAASRHAALARASGKRAVRSTDDELGAIFHGQQEYDGYEDASGSSLYSALHGGDEILHADAASNAPPPSLRESEHDMRITVDVRAGEVSTAAGAHSTEQVYGDFPPLELPRPSTAAADAHECEELPSFEDASPPHGASGIALHEAYPPSYVDSSDVALRDMADPLGLPAVPCRPAATSPQSAFPPAYRVDEGASNAPPHAYASQQAPEHVAFPPLYES